MAKRRRRRRKGDEPQFSTVDEMLAWRSEQGRIHQAKRKTFGGPAKKSSDEKELERLIKEIEKNKSELRDGKNDKGGAQESTRDQ
jgi:hypothetical protein